MAAYRTHSGAAVYLPEPIDVPDVYEDPPALRCDLAARRHQLQRWAVRGFILAFLLTCMVAGFMIPLAQSADAQRLVPVPCVVPADLAKHLAKEYDEAPIARGVLGDGSLLEVYFSEAKGTWTIVITKAVPAGMKSCIVASGRGFEILHIGDAT